MFEAEPLVFFDEENRVRGFYIDILDAVAEREGWRLQYVAGTWEDHRPGVEAGTIDLLPGIASQLGLDEELRAARAITSWNSGSRRALPPGGGRGRSGSAYWPSSSFRSHSGYRPSSVAVCLITRPRRQPGGR